MVPADLRLFDSVNLSTDEALLTGESMPTSKFANQTLTRVDIPIGDRANMVYSASMVTRGRGSGIVISTAMLTEVGKIAALLQDKKASASEGNILVRSFRKTVAVMKHALGLVGSPLQVKLSKFALLLFGLAILLAIIVFSTAKWDVTDEVLIYGICVAVAVIPESLIAVLTLTIAVGTKAMAKSNIIIRKLSSLEAVGGVSNICSDKTGTLTQGKMIVRGHWSMAQKPCQSRIRSIPLTLPVVSWNGKTEKPCPMFKTIRLSTSFSTLYPFATYLLFRTFPRRQLALLRQPLLLDKAAGPPLVNQLK